MDWLDFIAWALASHGALDTWFKGSIFAEPRSLLQDKLDSESGMDPATRGIFIDDSESAPLPWHLRLLDKWIPLWLAELLTCEFCLSHHTPWLLGVLFIIPASLVPWGWLALLIKLPVYSLAFAKIRTIAIDSLDLRRGSP